jgi:transcription-repair coupling factor (superfamily II helicase)
MTELPLLPLPASGEQRWPELPGGARALALATAAAADRRLWVVVADDARGADLLRQELDFFAAPGLEVLHLPDWEVLPYERFSPLPDLVSGRIATLARLPLLARGILIASAETLVQRLPPTAYIEGRCFDLAVGDAFPLEAARARLTVAGYAAVAQVSSPGEFALRGSLFDLFPMGSELPVRIDLLDDRVDSIRAFDPDTQRSLDRLDNLRLLPAREFPLDEAACRDFRRRYRTRFEGDPSRSAIYRGVREGAAPAGIEFYLPLFFDSTATLFDYLPGKRVIVTDGRLAGAAAAIEAAINARFEEMRHDIERPVLEPRELFLDAAALQDRLDGETRVVIGAPGADGALPASPFGAAPTLRLDARAEQPFAPLAAELQASTVRTLVVADSPGRREVLGQWLRAAGIVYGAVGGWQAFLDSDAPVGLTAATGVGGLRLHDPPLAIYADGELFGQRASQERRRRRTQLDPQAILRDLQDLADGAAVVHEQYGVGRFAGLQKMAVADQDGEFLVIEYAGGDRIYVPVASLHLVSRYTGASAEAAPLHKLGTDQWAKARRRASEQVRDVAADLLDLYARREARKGFALGFDEREHQAFAAGFPFEETADQAEAIRSVVADLRAEKPMDRVVCGDVGFGKTEVAMRAAFVAVQSGRQVAVLAPTTLLAEQHLARFRDRFADLPVRIESLSRFRSGRDSAAILADVEAGRIDILVATHRLLHADARFRQLGLLVIDEEHRFGVRDKERLKALRADVHVLTLTATPIPRTLNMALGGLRDLSLITTPPAGRVSIKTFVTEWNDAAIREACLRELRRGGQIYFVHNEISSIERVGADLRRLLPEVQLRIGHGQMRERDLEQLMVDFYHRRFDLLLCTTIIESGIDVPTANTIMINAADRLGLAQLHQLRGRVGRSHHRAYAHLIVPSLKGLSKDAQRRLEAIESAEELGAGFVLATHDLEIRGAGEFLGEAQSGQVQEIGLSMYLDMLQTAVRALREGREPELDRPLSASTEVNLHLPCLLPDDYIGDVHTRLGLYKRIAAAPDGPALDELTAEIVDRFGELPAAADRLLAAARLVLRCRQLGLRHLDVSAQSSHVSFQQHNSVDPGAVIALLQKDPRTYRMEGPLKLRIARGAQDADRPAFANRLLDQLAVRGAAPAAKR